MLQKAALDFSEPFSTYTRCLISRNDLLVPVSYSVVSNTACRSPLEILSKFVGTFWNPPVLVVCLVIIFIFKQSLGKKEKHKI